MGTNLFDYLIILSGLYLVYTGINMKQTGEIKTGVIVSKDVDVTSSFTKLSLQIRK